MSESDQPDGSAQQIPIQMTNKQRTLRLLLRKSRTIHRNQQYRAKETSGMFTRGNGSVDVWRSTKPCLPEKAQR